MDHRADLASRDRTDTSDKPRAVGHYWTDDGFLRSLSLPPEENSVMKISVYETLRSC